MRVKVRPKSGRKSSNSLVGLGSKRVKVNKGISKTPDPRAEGGDVLPDAQLIIPKEELE